MVDDSQKHSDSGEAGTTLAGGSSGPLKTPELESLVGRELDAAVAERVMGWWNYHGIWCRGEKGKVGGNGTGWISYPVTGTAFQYALGSREYGEYTPRATYDADAEQHVFAPSTDIAAAMEVAEKMAQRGFSFALKHYVATKEPDEDLDARWCAFFYDTSENFQRVGATAPEAICRAALAAVSTQDEVGRK